MTRVGLPSTPPGTAVRPARRWWWLAAAGGVAFGLAGAWLAVGAPTGGADAGAAPEAVARVVAPGVRIRVRVLNGSGARGLARRAAFHLRDAGFDVVEWDNDSTQGRRETAIEVNRGDAAAGDLARTALGTGRVALRPDSTRYVELTVRLGSDWRAPAQPFRP